MNTRAPFTTLIIGACCVITGFSFGLSIASVLGHLVAVQRSLQDASAMIRPIITSATLFALYLFSVTMLKRAENPNESQSNDTTEPALPQAA